MERVVVMAAHDSIHLREYELSVEHQQTGQEVSHASVQITDTLPYEFAVIRLHKLLGAARRWW